MENISKNNISSIYKTLENEVLPSFKEELIAKSPIGCKEFSITQEKEEHIFYNLPKYYDLAFERDIESDIRFFQKCFENYSESKVSRILEVACGTGMFLEVLSRYGYEVVGYDLSEAMVEYTKLRLQKANLHANQADVVLGNMKNKIFEQKFDAAFICVNSLGYLKNEGDIFSHFEVMAQNVKKGGLYIVEISCKCDDISNEKRIDETWCIKKEGITLELTWKPCSYDLVNRIRYIDFRMLINDNGMINEIREVHQLRLWLYDEFKQFVTSQGFEIVAIYNQSYESIPIDKLITGEFGVLFYVLKNNGLI